MRGGVKERKKLSPFSSFPFFPPSFFPFPSLASPLSNFLSQKPPSPTLPPPPLSHKIWLSSCRMGVGEGSSEARRKSSGLSARSYACSSPLELRTKAKAPAGCQRIMEIGFLKKKRGRGSESKATESGRKGKRGKRKRKEKWTR